MGVLNYGEYAEIGRRDDLFRLLCDHGVILHFDDLFGGRYFYDTQAADKFIDDCQKRRPPGYPEESELRQRLVQIAHDLGFAPDGRAERPESADDRSDEVELDPDDMEPIDDEEGVQVVDLTEQELMLMPVGLSVRWCKFPELKDPAELQGLLDNELNDLDNDVRRRHEVFISTRAAIEAERERRRVEAARAARARELEREREENERVRREEERLARELEQKAADAKARAEARARRDVEIDRELAQLRK